MTIIKEITSILNNEQTSLDEKFSMLRGVRDHRKGNNKITVLIILNILQEYYLPMSNERFDEGKQLFKDANDIVYNNIKSIAKKSNMQLFNASCNEFLFYHYHEFNMAKASIESYYGELIAPTDPDDEFAFIKHALGICRLFSKIGVRFIDNNEFLNLCNNFIDSKKDDGYTPLFLLCALIRISEFSNYADNKISELVTHFDNIDNYQKAIDYRDELITIHKKDSAKVKALRWEIVKLLEKQADTFDWENSSDSFHIISIVQNAMNVLNQINDDKSKAERKKLAKSIEPVKVLSLQQMQCISSGPIDISPAIDSFEKQIDNLSFEEAISALMFHSNPIGLQNCIDNLSKRGSISDLFASNILDSKGRTICVVSGLMGASDEDKMHCYEHEAMKHNQLMSQAFYSNYLKLFNKKYTVTKDNIRFILEDNLFVPEERIDSFITGIVAGFNFDFITALPVLMPQVENSIRLIAEELGAVVYKTADDGSVECLSFEGVLDLPEVKEAFEEDFIFNLRVHYTSKYGFGMRNNVGHGLEDDGLLNSYNGLAVWWYTFRLCCQYSYNLRKAIAEIKLRNKNQQ